MYIKHCYPLKESYNNKNHNNTLFDPNMMIQITISKNIYINQGRGRPQKS